MDKTIHATSRPDTGKDKHDPTIEDLAIGELVSFYITVTLPKSQTLLTVYDYLPITPGLMEVISSSVISVGANLSGPGNPLRTVPGRPSASTPTGISTCIDDTVTFSFRDRDERAGLRHHDGRSDRGRGNRRDDRQSGQRQRAGHDQHGDGRLSGPGTISDSDRVEVVEPFLSMTKTAVPERRRRRRYHRVHVANCSTRAASTLNAYELVITDPLTDPNLLLTVGSVTTTVRNGRHG